jgi:hypothetical protein
MRWLRPRVAPGHLTVARVAEGLGVAWNTANDAVLAEGKRVLIDDPTRFDGVAVVGADEHVWRHTSRGDKYVTVIIDLTTIRERHRPGMAARHACRGRGDLGHLPADDRRLPPRRPPPWPDLMTALIDSVSKGVPAALVEVVTLGRTLKKRADDVLAYFDRPGTSNGPTEAINGRLEHLRGSALGFRNLTNYIARSLLETGGFRPRLHPHL